MSHNHLKTLYTVTIFLSALLLFSVQPMIAKMILPELGGSPAVWQTVMLFFQILLLAGYGYVHFTTTKLSLKWQIITHRLILICAFGVLPFTMNAGTLFDRNIYPILWLFETLIYSVSIPFFILSTTAPILQKWFSLSSHSNAKNPYFLYSASNIGSLVALLSYPFLIEPLLILQNQTLSWSGLFVLFFIFIIYITTGVNTNNVPLKATDNPSISINPPTWTEKLTWCFLSFIPSSLMLGVTSHITTDIAAMPLLWVIPFALYLISFIVVFSKNMTGYNLSKKLLPYAVVVALLMLIFQEKINIMQCPTVLFVCMTLLCFLCIAIRYHGELVEKKPTAENLTYFYLCMSIGGALGGVFNALLAPVVFSDIYEYKIIVLLSAVLCIRKFKSPTEYIILITPAFFIIFLGSFFYFNSDDVFRERNFFGVSRVAYNDKFKAKIYYHGTTNHGMQSTLEKYRLKPMAYYSGINDFINLLPDDVKQKPMAITGLGVGTLTCYANQNQFVDIYEIDPVVIKIANNPDLFTYMRDCKGNKNIILGDARINLQKADDNRYGFMIMDAYSSDSLPVHLLTKEALAIYLTKLDDNGIIAFHISNRHLDLKPVLASFKEHFKLSAYIRSDMNVKKLTKHSLYTQNEWVILSKNPTIFDKIIPDDKWKPLESSNQSMWTDNYSSIFSILK